ncbi:hypothetical protein BI364_04320 [Acidihalobacter yilgarnensis]|uniref:BPL/LPL catalytic domain-containing protein n=1 Tax=Acidihalobacter yilgarnensis TaxID=2819280 RepID=A0A1D8ILI3_9GAMM|nr:lipoate--protein ligase family protein [Acidihalobacter yilgarnensis]AOU97319.1 hypothetical protein BI364_04320 [Acidihalobacter yilgarnensis]
MSRLKFYDAGWLSPYALHASYAGLAASLGEGDEAWLVLARADQGHIALGASQYADAELDLNYCRMRRIPVVQRALGGGTVWVDSRQLCLFFIFPRGLAPRSHGALFDTCLDVLVEAYAQVGVTVTRVGGQDLWCAGRKLLGSGAASIGQAIVFGASILERFDAESFAACVDCSSRGFQTWLREALAEGMTDLLSLGYAQRATRFADVLRAVCDTRWDTVLARPDAVQNAAIAAVEHELRQSLELGGRRLVRGGLKINRETYLLEDTTSPWLRLLWRGGSVMRAASADHRIDTVLQACVGRPLAGGRLVYEQALAHGLSEAMAQSLVLRVEGLCRSLGQDA